MSHRSWPSRLIVAAVLGSLTAGCLIQPGRTAFSGATILATIYRSSGGEGPLAAYYTVAADGGVTLQLGSRERQGRLRPQELSRLRSAVGQEMAILRTEAGATPGIDLPFVGIEVGDRRIAVDVAAVTNGELVSLLRMLDKAFAREFRRWHVMPLIQDSEVAATGGAVGRRTEEEECGEAVSHRVFAGEGGGRLTLVNRQAWKLPWLGLELCEVEQPPAFSGQARRLGVFARRAGGDWRFIRRDNDLVDGWSAVLAEIVPLPERSADSLGVAREFADLLVGRDPGVLVLNDRDSIPLNRMTTVAAGVRGRLRDERAVRAELMAPLGAIEPEPPRWDTDLDQSKLRFWTWSIQGGLITEWVIRWLPEIAIEYHVRAKAVGSWEVSLG